MEILQSQRRVPRLNKRTISNFPVQIYRITIIFASETNENVGEHVGDLSDIKLTERQQNIIALIKSTPTISAKQMSETLSVSSRTIERDLAALKSLHILSREGKDNDGIWIVMS